MESLKLNSKGKSGDLVSFFLPTKKKIYQLLGNVSLMREPNFIAQESWPCSHRCSSLKVGFDSVHYTNNFTEEKSLCLPNHFFKNPHLRSEDIFSIDYFQREGKGGEGGKRIINMRETH